MNKERHAWSRVIDIENCKMAVLDEAGTKRCIRNGMAVEMREETRAFAETVRQRLMDGFVPNPFTEFDHEEYGKIRRIKAPNVEDAICHRAVTRILEPLVYKRMIPGSCCPVTNKGGLYLARHLKRDIARCEETCRIHNKRHKQEWKTWILKSDIRHYFPSITFEVALEAMERIFDEREIIKYLTSNLAGLDGLPIGAGYSSMIANAILIPMDWKITSMKEVRGYYRYMDDTVVVTRSKKAAAKVHEEMEAELSKIGLTTAQKWSKFPASHHAPEVGGWRVAAKGIYPSSRIEKHLMKLLRGDPMRLKKKGKRALTSLYGYIKNGDSQTLKRKWKEKNASRIFQEVG